MVLNVTLTESVFNDFKKMYEGQITKSNYKSDTDLKEILFCIEPNNLTDKDTLTQTILNLKVYI